MDVQTQIKAMYFDSLVKELYSLHNMYMDFSNNNDNIIACSAFALIAKDLQTLLNRYDNKEGVYFDRG